MHAKSWLSFGDLLLCYTFTNKLLLEDGQIATQTGCFSNRTDKPEPQPLNSKQVLWNYVNMANTKNYPCKQQVTLKSPVCQWRMT